MGRVGMVLTEPSSADPASPPRGDRISPPTYPYPHLQSRGRFDQIQFGYRFVQVLTKPSLGGYRELLSEYCPPGRECW